MTITGERSRAWKDGYLGHEIGMVLAANPFIRPDRNQDEHKALEWHNGWNEARARAAEAARDAATARRVGHLSVRMVLWCGLVCFALGVLAGIAIGAG